MQSAGLAEQPDEADNTWPSNTSAKANRGMWRLAASGPWQDLPIQLLPGMTVTNHDKVSKKLAIKGTPSEDRASK